MADPPLSDLYQQMTRMRLLESALGELWWDGLISGELHLGIGEEGIAAGVTSHLVDGDAMALDHRSTPPMVGRGADLLPVLLEILGHPDGSGGGMGGHMHLFDPERLIASSGIVGASGPMACGFAMAHQMTRPESVAVAFFGESAINQGMLMESMNLAVVWDLPVVFVCKDNGWAITTRSPQMTAGKIVRRARSFDMPTWKVDGSSAAEVWSAAAKAVSRARNGKGPSFIHATCHRPHGHFEDDPLLRLGKEPGLIGSEARAMARGGLDFGAGGLTDRLSGALELAGTLGKVASSRLGSQKDPLAEARNGLTEAEVEVIDSETHEEIERLLAEALERLEVSR